MANCSNDLINLDPSCGALKKKGGVNKKVWVAKHDVATLTTNVSGEVDTITLAVASPANVLNTFIGKQLKHNGAVAGEVSDADIATVKQDLNLVLFAEEQTERASIDALFQSDYLLVFIETEAGKIECWGYDTGLKPSALAGGTGTALGDSTAFTITLTGSQDGVPKICKFGANLAADIAYLNALT